jgi:CheY-like chemotaxis protein
MPSTSSPRAAEPAAPLQILVADDNETLRAAVRGLLRNLGHSVETVSNGPDAVEAAARRAFDLVFLDVQMPGMGGFEVARSLRQGQRRPEGPATSIIGLSGEGEDPDAYAAAGMDDFLVKPVRLGDLVRVLDRVARP